MEGVGAVFAIIAVVIVGIAIGEFIADKIKRKRDNSLSLLLLKSLVLPNDYLLLIYFIIIKKDLI